MSDQRLTHITCNDFLKKTTQKIPKPGSYKTTSKLNKKYLISATTNSKKLIFETSFKKCNA